MSYLTCSLPPVFRCRHSMLCLKALYHAANSEPTQPPARCVAGCIAPCLQALHHTLDIQSAKPFHASLWQVTLFRAHKHCITPAALEWRQTFKPVGNSAWLVLYANGKSAVRPDAPGVKQVGQTLRVWSRGVIVRPDAAGVKQVGHVFLMLPRMLRTHNDERC